MLDRTGSSDTPLNTAAPSLRFKCVGWLAGLLAAFAGVGASVAATVPAALDVAAGERLLVVAPHPDDETLGAGGLIQRVLERGGTVRIVLVTAGDGYVEAVVHETGLPRPRPSQYIAYGERRLREARAAVRELGSDRMRLQVLGFPDGGLASLLHAHWRRIHSERSSTTGVSEPPYPEALDPNVAYDGTDLRRELLRLVRETHPTMVALPHPFDRHPDHRATGLFTLLAIDDWAGEAARPRAPLPRLLAYLVHWPNWPPGWNAPTPPPAAATATFELPPTFPVQNGTPTDLALSDAEVAAKRAALAEYKSQQEEMASLLAAFVRHTEPFVLLTAPTLPELERMIDQSAGTAQKLHGPHDRGTPSP
ncbi:MAG: PIG-L deacetylase family protein [Candidatus Binatia bacterium]